MLIFVSLCLSVANGVSGVAVTVIAIQDLGYNSADFSYLISACSFVAALLSLALGPLIDQYGAKRFLMIGLIGLIGNGLGLLLTGVFTDLWSNIYFCIAFIVMGAFLSQCTFISFIALHMKVCWLKVATTQFAIYMAWSNLGKSIGAGLYSQIKSSLYQGQEFILIGFLSSIGAGVLVLVNMRDHKQRIEKLDVDGGIPDAVRV